MAVPRCDWGNVSAEMIAYHDTEWGVPVHSDEDLFEMLVLGGAQAGLNWSGILKRRAGYRKAFADFDLAKVARFTAKRIDRLVENPAIIRNRQKINSAINNARKIGEVQKEFGSLAGFLWSFVGGAAIDHRCKTMRDLPTVSPEAEAMSAALKKRGFSFVGPTICYAFMQTVGMVNDHIISCYRYAEIKRMKPAGRRRSGTI
jgi:DNA-3-methyladenine glycosylase I